MPRTNRGYRELTADIANKSNQDWSIITNSDDPDFTATSLTETLTRLIDSCTETKTYSNKLTPLKPWMTRALLLSLRNRDQLARLTKRYPDNTRLLIYYRKVRNIVSKAIRTARDLEIKRNIDRNREDKRKLWTVIHDILDKPNNKSKIKTITHDNTDYNCDTDTTTCANIMNKYFKNVGKNVAETIERTNTLNVHDNHQTEQNVPNYRLSTFDPTTPTGVLKTLNKMKTNSAPGEDYLQTKILKNIIQYILTPLTHVFNLSLDKGHFPQCYKNSIIVPIHKKGNTKLLPNYRPISLLTTFSKLLEKLVQHRLDKYLRLHDILTHRQYGFRTGIGTEDALIDLTTYLYDNLDKGKKIIASFLDIAKAYDTIQHTKLLEQLRNIGLSDTVLTWFTSYLTNRTQQVRLNSQLSDVEQCQPFSIVQGSCLGPVLFNCFINNLPGISLGQVFCYADDTVVCYTSDTWEETHNIATTDLTNIGKWYSSMSLKINFDKSNYMTFAIDSRGLPTTSTLQLTLDSTNTITLERLTKTRYLGVLIDQHLKWTDHINQLKSKLRHLMLEGSLFLIPLYDDFKYFNVVFGISG
ncbi:hypothetical protein M8J77_025187 [Diaphorina citri]|nr:hypothetical protein M8J77_025187 [Diaphorina citri]